MTNGSPESPSICSADKLGNVERMEGKKGKQENSATECTSEMNFERELNELALTRAFHRLIPPSQPTYRVFPPLSLALPFSFT